MLLWVLGFSVGTTASWLQFKRAADSSGWTAVWYFVLGNVIGAICPIALTFALRRGHPNLVYALALGGSFALLQIVSWRLFRQPMSVAQWSGVGCVGLGVVLLQLR